MTLKNMTKCDLILKVRNLRSNLKDKNEVLDSDLLLTVNCAASTAKKACDIIEEIKLIDRLNNQPIVTGDSKDAFQPIGIENDKDKKVCIVALQYYYLIAKTADPKKKKEVLDLIKNTPQVLYNKFGTDVDKKHIYTFASRGPNYGLYRYDIDNETLYGDALVYNQVQSVHFNNWDYEAPGKWLENPVTQYATIIENTITKTTVKENNNNIVKLNKPDYYGPLYKVTLSDNTTISIKRNTSDPNYYWAFSSKDEILNVNKHLNPAFTLIEIEQAKQLAPAEFQIQITDSKTLTDPNSLVQQIITYQVQK